MTLTAGSTFIVVLAAEAAKHCDLAALGPYEGQSISWSLPVSGVPLKLTLHTKPNATPGQWTLRAACRQSDSAAPSLANLLLRVHGQTNGHGLIAEHAGLTFAQLTGHAQTLHGNPAAAGVKVVTVSVSNGGRGGGGDPGDDYPAKWRNAAQDSMLDNWKEYNRECTSFAAWALASRNGFNMPFNDDAINWGPRASALGIAVNANPSPGSIAWSNAGHYGHVAYVQDVSGNSVHIEEYNEYGNGTYSSRTVPASSFTGYIHFKDLGAAPFNPAAYNGHIVKQDNGSATSWLVVDAQGHRNYIPTGAVYNCLLAAGHPGPDILSAAQLDRLPDQNGVWANCAPPPPPATTTVVTVITTLPTTTTQPPPTTTTQPTTTSSADRTAPSAPGGLSPSGQTTSSITLSWNASSDNVAVTGYRLYLNGGQVTDVGGTSYSFGGLACGNAYTLGVAAYDLAGNLSGTSSVSATTSGCPPPPPSISASKGGHYGCSNCYALDVQVHNFPTGTYTYYCHDNSGPGGSDTIFFQHSVAINDPNQSSWPGVFCDDNSPYVAYVVINGVQSNSVGF